MNDDRGHIAMPKLYGAPAYARPPVVPVARAERPFDPDDLPLESEQTSEDREQAAQLHHSPDARPVEDASANGRGANRSPGGWSIRARLPGRRRSGS